MNTTAVRTFQEFLALPVESVKPYVPSSILFAPGGTRRAAILAGRSEREYPYWAHAAMLQLCHSFVPYGVRHIYTGMILQTQERENTGWYAGQMAKWAERIMATPEAIAEYRRLGFRIRVVGTAMAPAFAPLAEKLRDVTPEGDLTLWFLTAPDVGDVWRWMFDAVRRENVHSQAELIRALYGEDLPPAPLCLSYGKPMMGVDFLPPFLQADRVQCYWPQKPGYAMTDLEWRGILYDYAMMRNTWSDDKSGREHQALEHRDLWENGPILGLGQRIGPFWYPTHGGVQP